MKKDIRFVICLTVILLLALLCIFSIISDKNNDKDKDPGIPDSNIVPTQRTIILPSGKDSTVVLDTVSYYTVRVATRNIEIVESAVGQGITLSPKLIAEYISDALEDEEIELKVIGTEMKDGVCIVNFDSAMKQIASNDTGIEKLILDAYSMSIIDNCSDVYGVSFKIEGEPYSTDGFSLKDGEVYLKS